MKPLVVNLFAGPGAGKSSMMASVFSFLKWNDVNCEMAPEYAKEVVWEKTENLLKNQVYVFGQQHQRICRLISQVDVIITDSPLLLSIIYDPSKDKNLRELILGEFNKLNNKNYFILRKKKYNPSGRIQQTVEEAQNIDHRIKELLQDYSIPFREIAGVPENAQTIGTDVLKELENN